MYFTHKIRCKDIFPANIKHRESIPGTCMKIAKIKRHDQKAVYSNSQWWKIELNTQDCIQTYFCCHIPAFTLSLHMPVAIFEKLLIFSAVLTASLTTWSTGKTLLTRPERSPVYLHAATVEKDIEQQWIWMI